MSTPVAHGAAAGRRALVRATLTGRRATARLVDTGNALVRRARGASGTPTLPRAVWSAASREWVRDPGAPLHRRVVPLPAAASLTRALTGRRRPSLDAWCPLGPRPASSPAVLLLPTGSAAPGAWPARDAAALVATRSRTLPRARLHTVVFTGPGEAGRLVRLLRAAQGRDLSGVLVVSGPAVDAPTRAARRLPAALGLVDAVLVPDPQAVSPVLTDLAAAAGRAVVGPERRHEAWEALADEGRAARLALVDRERSDAGPLPGLAAPRASGTRALVVHEPRRVVVAGHDLKFAGGLIAELRACGHEVRLDEWGGHERHDVAASRALAAWADVVHCEWSLGNLVWWTRHLDSPRRTVRLTSRLHLQEAGTEFPGRVRQDALDAWVFVAEHVREQVLRDTGFPAERSAVVPNAVMIPAAAPTGDDERRFVLGLVGVLPERKGLHRALDLLAALRAEDPRYRLRIRGRRPAEVPWMSGRPDAAGYFATQERRMAEDPLLAGAVAWDPFGPDMDAWYARVGVALSVSDFESFHFTLPDGAVHGCLPRALAWAGADLLYPTGWLAPSTADLVRSVREATADSATWDAEVAASQTYVRSRFSADVVVSELAGVVLGG